MELSTVILLGGFSIFVGVLIGGVGIGGVLLVPVLTYVLGMEIHVAIAAAMFGYIFIGIIGATIYARHGSIQWSTALWMIAGATPAAFLGSMVASFVPAQGLELIISLFILLAGFNALRRRAAVDGERDITNPLALIAIGVVTGVGSALTGTGGPLFVVPIMVSLKVAAHAAIGFSQAVQAPLASLATVGNFLYGTVDIFVGGIIAIGLVFGGIIGAKLAHVVSPSVLKRLVAWVLVAVGVFIIVRLLLNLNLFA